MNRGFIVSFLFLISCAKNVVTPAIQSISTPGTPAVVNSKDSIIDFYIEAGQSNCGRAQFPGTGTTGDTATAEDFKLYSQPINGFQIYNPGYSAVTFSTIQAGVNTMLVDFISKAEMGSEVSFLTQLKKSGIDSSYLLKYGIGNTNLANEWLNKYIYQLFIYADKNIRIIQSTGRRPLLKAFIWIQGENDASDSIMAASYFANLTSFFNKFDSFYNAEMIQYNLPGNSINYKKIIGRINGKDDPEELYRNEVRTAEEHYCANRLNSALLIDTDAYPTFNHGHYTLSGQIQFGIDIYNALNGFYY
jgi:hypothetical protein